MKSFLFLLLSVSSLLAANPPMTGRISGGRALSSNDVVNIITNVSGNQLWFTNPAAASSISNAYNVKINGRLSTDSSTASGSGSVALGLSSLAQSQYTIAGGVRNSALGAQSFAVIGSSNTASAEGSYAGGVNSSSGSAFDFVHGINNASGGIAPGFVGGNTVIFGLNNSSGDGSVNNFIAGVDVTFDPGVSNTFAWNGNTVNPSGLLNVSAAQSGSFIVQAPTGIILNGPVSFDTSNNYIGSFTGNGSGLTNLLPQSLPNPLWTNSSVALGIWTNPVTGGHLDHIPGTGLIYSNKVTGAASLLTGTNGGMNIGATTSVGQGNLVVQSNAIISGVGITNGVPSMPVASIFRLASSTGSIPANNRITNFNASKITSSLVFAVNATNGYITNLNAQTILISFGFYGSSAGADVIFTIMTNDVASPLVFGSAESATRAFTCEFPPMDLPANTRISIQHAATASLTNVWLTAKAIQ